MTGKTLSRACGVVLVVFALLVGIAACGDDDDGGSSNGIEIFNVWGRSTPPTAEVTAFYMSISNNTDQPDRLAGGSSEACGMIELHNTTMGDDDVMSMAPASPEELTVAANASLLLAPGGLHVMCMKLTAPLEVGDEVALDLEFEQAGVVSTVATIEDR